MRVQAGDSGRTADRGEHVSGDAHVNHLLHQHAADGVVGYVVLHFEAQHRRCVERERRMLPSDRGVQGTAQPGDIAPAGVEGDLFGAGGHGRRPLGDPARPRFTGTPWSAGQLPVRTHCAICARSVISTYSIRAPQRSGAVIIANGTWSGAFLNVASTPTPASARALSRAAMSDSQQPKYRICPALSALTIPFPSAWISS